MASLASGKTLQLSRKLSPGDTTLYANVDIGVTSGRLFFQSTDTVEWVSFSGVAATGSGDYAYSNLVRQLSQTADPVVSTGTGYSWLATTEAELVYMHDQMIDKNVATQSRQEALTFATTAARDAALGGNGVCTYNYTDIKVTATGLFYNYNTTTAQWEVQGTGTATPNGSETVSGSFEEATQAENDSGASVGGTGADLVSTPAKSAATIQKAAWIYTSSADVSDTYTANLTPALTAYTTGMKVRVKFTTVNTGACTLNLNSLGAKAIKTRAGNDPQDGDIAAGSIRELTYDGTNFVLDVNKATTAEKGIVEMATDAEATTGTDQERYINAYQAKTNYGIKTHGTLAQISASVDTGSSGTQVSGTLTSTAICVAAWAATAQDTSGSYVKLEYNDGSGWTTVYNYVGTGGGASVSYNFMIKKGDYRITVYKNYGGGTTMSGSLTTTI